MKRYLLLLSLIVVALAGVATVTHAQSEQPMTDERVEVIRANCKEAIVTLDRLHASDGLLRVNRGQLFESISTKLMTPFNNRLNANQLERGLLPAISEEYVSRLDTFRSDYQDYEKAMTRTLMIDCTRQPVTFYDAVVETRTKRQKVHDSSVLLQDSIRKYRAEVDVFVGKFKEVAQ
jgi:hypothetical protein